MLPLSAEAPQTAAPQQINLAEWLAGGKLRAVNRDVTALEGDKRGVKVSEKAGPGVVWIEGSDFDQGTIEIDVRGRDVLQQSFLGIAFHGKDDKTYEAVYLRPFNFRAQDPDRHQHAVQYVAVPDYDWPRLRKEFPEEFENPVDASVAPTDWVPLRVVVKGNARPDIRRQGQRADTRGPQTRSARPGPDWPVGREQQRRRLHKSARYTNEISLK